MRINLWIGFVVPYCLSVVTVSSYVSLVMAVDRAKFRTCAQTSFCRRHRGGHSAGLYQFKLKKDSIQFQIPNEDKATHTKTDPAPPVDEVPKATMLQSLTSRILGNRNKDKGYSSYNDEHFKGPSAAFLATLVNTANNKKEEELALSLHLHEDGVTRLRITEKHEQNSAYEPRWTSDELVLNVEEMLPSTNVQMIDGETVKNDDDFQSALQYIMVSEHQDVIKENYVMLKYALQETSTFCFLFLQLEPFSIFLWRGEVVDGSPIVSINTENWMHFEVRRSKQDDQRRKLSENEDPKAVSEDNVDRHGGKEIVGKNINTRIVDVCSNCKLTRMECAVPLNMHCIKSIFEKLIRILGRWTSNLCRWNT